jgi:Uma2 family endonuclease
MAAVMEMLQEPAPGKAGHTIVLDADLRRHLLEALLTPMRPRKMTYNEFLAWANEDTLAEWVDGEVQIHSPASEQHQDLSFFLAQIMDIYAKSKRLGKILLPPFQMKLPRSGREPDLIFVATGHLDRLKPTFLDGPADLVVEVISTESLARDRGEKFYEYEEAGIPEYWLIDPIRERVEFYRLDAQGRYDLILPDVDGVYRTPILPGFWLRVAWLWSPPAPLTVLRELQLI